MIVYWVLLLITAFFAYVFGCMDTMVLASNFVFHRNLRRLGDSRLWYSNFRRIFGFKGFVWLAVVELVKDLLPILIGGLLLGIRGHADAGRAFAGFVMVLGRLWSLFYDFKGSHASFAMVVAAFAADTSVGAAVLVVTVAAIALTRYLSLGTLIGAVVYALVAVLVVDDALILRLALLTAALVVIRHIPALIRVFRRTEPKLSFEQDITYKLDE
ncbi:MAG: glycerol-3-phosphate acyltransferase [Oscillospiraceae bacterium]|nr:glycerol-3-phosphate acyltransferase [Oscillospiraceae bacterium]